MNRRREMVF